MEAAAPTPINPTLIGKLLEDLDALAGTISFKVEDDDGAPSTLIGFKKKDIKMGEEVELLVKTVEHFPAKINSTSSVAVVKCMNTCVKVQAEKA